MDKELYYKKIKLLSCLLVAGLSVGSIFFNLLWRFQGSVFQNEWGMILNSVLAATVADILKWFQNNMIWILIIQIMICVLGLMKIGKIVVEGIAISGGFWFGAMETLLLLSNNLKDSIVFLFKIVLVVFVHAAVLCVSLVLSCSMSSLKWAKKEKNIKQHHQLKKYLISVLGILFLHLVYISFVYYVNYRKYL